MANGKYNDMDFSMLCHQYSLVLKSGIHPVERITLISEDTKNPSMKKVLNAISDEVVHGSSLYKVFEVSKCYHAYMVAP